MTDQQQDLWEALLDEAIAKADALIAARKGRDPQCDHQGIGKPNCPVCDPRERK